MTERKVVRAQKNLTEQASVLTQAMQIAEPFLDEQTVDHVAVVLERAEQRRQLSSEHVVIGIFGATGSGKSTLFNKIVGSEIAQTGVIRPTTTNTVAAIWNPEGAGELLDWLEVTDRHVVHDQSFEKGWGFKKDLENGGLLLLDLPDMDSTSVEHHIVTSRLAGQVDFMIWVLDPQKYADLSIHGGYLGELTNHQGNILIALNQIDLLSSSDRAVVEKSLAEILRAEGLESLDIVMVSAITGEGVEKLRGRISKIAQNKALATRKLKADIDQVIVDLNASIPVQNVPIPGKLEQAALESSISQAHNVVYIAEAAESSYLLRASANTGWPLTTWLVKLKNDPLKRLNLGRGHQQPELNATSRPALSVAQSAAISLSTDQYLQKAFDGLPTGWSEPITAEVSASLPEMNNEIDVAIASTDLVVDRKSWWWPLTRMIQWVSLAAALLGSGWLGAIAVAGYLQFQLPEPPRVEGIAVPTLILAIGLLLGIVLGLAGSFINRIVAKVKRKRVQRNLERSVAGVTRRFIVEPVDAQLEKYNNYAALISQAAQKAE